MPSAALASVHVAFLLSCLLAWPGAIRAEEGSDAEGPPKRAEAALLVALRARDYQVRRKAVLDVVGRKEPALFERVLQMAQDDPHPNIRGYTADVLSTFRDARVFAVLARMAQESSPGPQQSAFVGLGRYGDGRAYAILIQGLKAGRGRRGYAAKGLGLLGEVRAFGPVEACYRAHPEDPYLNDLAPAALVLLDEARGLAVCRACFDTLPAATRPALARELGQHASAATREFMLALLRTTRAPDLRNAAIGVLTSLADPKSADELLRAFPAYPKSRTGIARALGRLGERRAVVPLLDALGKGADAHVRNVYIQALGRIGDRRAVRTLIGLLDDLTFAAQPLERSAIFGFPWNVAVRGTALWALRSILDGSPPFELKTLVTFRRRPPSRSVTDGIARLKDWWKTHQQDETYWPASD